MSKFCGNCGAQMDDNAMVCGYCGTAFNSASGNNFKYEDPEKKAKIKKIIKKVIVAVVIVTVISIALSIGSSFIGYRGAVRKFMNAYKNENSEALVDMTCSFMQDEDYAEIVAYKYESRLENDFDNFDYHFDSKYSIKYEITNASKLSERQSKSVMEQLASNGLASEDDVDLIKKIMNVKVVITAKHGSDSTSTNKTIYLAKESDGWKLLDFE